MDSTQFEIDKNDSAHSQFLIQEKNNTGRTQNSMLWATDEDRWKTIRKNYPRTPGIVNLENGYFSHQSWKTINKHLDFEFDINVETSRFMRTKQQEEIEKARSTFSKFMGVVPETLAFTRNTTESLNTVILGFPWKSGDEVIIGDQDYGSMTEAFEQAAQRHGIVVKKVHVPQHFHIMRGFDNEFDDLGVYITSVVKSYTELISNKTKMVHITDLINLTGQVIPTDAIAKEIKKIDAAIMVVVDAAHSLAHTLGPDGYGIHTLMDAGVDAMGGSLHKWFCNPIGVGFLILKPEWIERIWPLMGDTGVARNNIRKFEHQGTRPIQSLQTIAFASQQHQLIGSEPKLRRLQYLKLSWMGLPMSELEESIFGKREVSKKYSNLVDLRTLADSDGKPKIQIYGLPNIIQNEKNGTSPNTMSGFPENPSTKQNHTIQGVKTASNLPRNTYYYQGAIATVSVVGYTPTELAKVLLDKFGIFTVAIDHPQVKGVRITPHLSSTFEDCYLLNQALVSLTK